VDFHSLSLPVNIGIFLVAGVCVWLAGAQLAGYADAVASRSGLSQAFIGVVMLGIATSLPEIATTVTAAFIGNPRLVVGNLFGGVALQIAVLAITDAAAVRGALTYFTPQPVLLFQGVMLLLLLAVALAGASAGEPVAFMGVGLTPFILLAGYLVTVRLSRPGDYLPRWRATNEPPNQNGQSAGVPDGGPERTMAGLLARSGVSGLVILAAGWALAQSGDALSEQTGLGASFVGVALVAGSTSLPELSTTISAVRRGNHEMAVSSILGTNCLELALLFLADVVYRGGPILAAVDRSAQFAGALGMVVTCLLLIGLLERRDRTVLRMGVDSLAVLVAYVSGLVGLYLLR
jgi:cation:H+ antiporter